MTTTGPIRHPRRALPAAATPLTGDPADQRLAPLHFCSAASALTSGHSAYLHGAACVDLIQLGGKSLDTIGVEKKNCNTAG